MSSPRGQKQPEDDRKGGNTHRGSSRGGGRGNRGTSSRGGGSGGGAEQGGGGSLRSNQSTQVTLRPVAVPVPPGIYTSGPNIPPPESSVKQHEDKLLGESKNQTDDNGFTGRCGYGTAGRGITLRTNYFRITTDYEDTTKEKDKKVDKLFRYHIKILPDPSKPKRRQFIEKLVLDPTFNGVHWATDYGSILVTASELELGETNHWIKEIIKEEDEEGNEDEKEWRTKDLTLLPANGTSQLTQQGPVSEYVKKARKRNAATIMLCFQRTFSFEGLIDHVKRFSFVKADFAGGDDVFQLLNIIVHKIPHASRTVANVGGNKFYPFKVDDVLEEGKNLGPDLRAQRGYFSSVRPTIGRLLLNLNVTSGAFYQPIALDDFISHAKRLNKDPLDVEAFLRMVRINVKYPRFGNREPFVKKKTIVGFAEEYRPVPPNGPALSHPPRIRRFQDASVEFMLSNSLDPNALKRQISVSKYFLEYHGIVLQGWHLPVLNVGTKKDPQYLPAELCEIAAGQAYRKLLLPSQTSDMIDFAARPPNANAISIAGTPSNPGNGLKIFDIANRSSQNVQSFGFSVETQMITVPGRVLVSPKVLYQADKPAQVKLGGWDLENYHFRQAAKFEVWKVFVIKEGLDDTFAQKSTELSMNQDTTINFFQTSIRKYGIQIGTRSPEVETIELLSLDNRNNRAKNNEKLNAAFKSTKAQWTWDNGVIMKGFVLVILPRQDRWLYARIKYYGDVIHGVHTINAIGKKISRIKGGPNFMANLALKLNVKGGGISHQVANTFEGPLGKEGKETIIFGIDVTHPSPGSSEGAPSIAAVVANTDHSLFRWPGSIRTQRSRQEIVDDETEHQETVDDYADSKETVDGNAAGKETVRTQLPRQEMVNNLKEMVLERLDLWSKKNSDRKPTRVVIYRDGVSESQFKQVLDRELPSFHEAYEERYGGPEKWPKTAIIIVGKRHHTRFYPTKVDDADSSSYNPLPGTVVDRGIVGHYIREFFLQAHQGIQGTAKPAHYSIIKDDIGFTADELERFTHYLCYYFARCTRAVSICPPAYYADLLAERGRAYLYTTMQENHGNRANATPEWDGTIHKDIKESTWYI